ncbi:MAG: DUF3493 domain-containing protein [Cyanobacteria bacterium SID2]|nr:DUF3493 domain-containing protein [Cyanobacteria bacterium SID2]MBP0004400.1 DUF3493 domain-containing protein [Cyanobacteria bacterium SBC]
MSDRTSEPTPERPRAARHLSDEKYQRLMAEVKAPYRGLRLFVYFAFAASGFIGAVVFLARLLGGRDVGSDLPNFALQLGVVALMVWLFRLETRSTDR